MENYADVLESYLIEPAEEGVVGAIVFGIPAALVGIVLTVSAIKTKIIKSKQKKQLKKSPTAISESKLICDYIKKNINKAKYFAYSENLPKYLDEYQKIIQKYQTTADMILKKAASLIDKPSDTVYDNYDKMLNDIVDTTCNNIKKLNETFDFGDKKQVSKDEFIKILNSYDIDPTPDRKLLDSISEKAISKYGEKLIEDPDDLAKSMNSKSCIYFLSDLACYNKGYDIDSTGLVDTYLWGVYFNFMSRGANIADRYMWIQF